MPTIDLHIHSSYSDGKLSVSELASQIKEIGLKYCALTDHDTVSGISELVEYLQGSGITVIPGVELTAKFGYNEIHLLAYDFEIDSVAEILLERNDLVTKQKIAEMKSAISLSREQGFDISDGLVPLPKQPVSLTVALDICSKKNNQDLLIARHGKEFIPEDIFYEYQAPGKPFYVERSGVTVEWLINKFKGVAQDLIIAHPNVSVSVVSRSLSMSEIENLIEAGMTGIEIYHDRTTDDQIKSLEKLVNDRNFSYTGGSDSHGRINGTPIGQYGNGNSIPGFKLTNYKLI